MHILGAAVIVSLICNKARLFLFAMSLSILRPNIALHASVILIACKHASVFLVAYKIVDRAQI